jgi:hypothetical protein
MPEPRSWTRPKAAPGSAAIRGAAQEGRETLPDALEARVRAARARKRLTAAVGGVAGDLVVKPVEVEVSRLAAFNAALKAAGGA